MSGRLGGGRFRLDEASPGYGVQPRQLRAQSSGRTHRALASGAMSTGETGTTLVSAVRYRSPPAAINVRYRTDWTDRCDHATTAG